MSEEIKAEWDKLDKPHKEFIIRVRNSNGAKGYAGPHYHLTGKMIVTDDGYECEEEIALWEIAEKSGFIECVGSWKWVVTEKFNELEGYLFGV